METHVIADTHFDHPDHLLYCGKEWCVPNPRHDPSKPFDFKQNNPLMANDESVEAYGQLIVDNWNALVAKKDRVIIDGDFAFANHARWAMRLRGHKVLIQGHHDDMKQEALKQFSEVHEFGAQKSICTGRLYPDGKSVKEDVTFCHYPLRSWPGSCDGSANIYAHDHGRMPELDSLLSFSCSTNVWGFIPIPWEAVQKRIDAKRAAMLAIRGKCEDGESAPRGTYSSDPEERIRAARRRNLAVLKSVGIDIPDDPTRPVAARPKDKKPDGDGVVSALIAVADLPTPSGRVYTRDALRRMADGKDFIWIEDSGKLVFRGILRGVANKNKVIEAIKGRIDAVGRADALPAQAWTIEPAKGDGKA